VKELTNVLDAFRDATGCDAVVWTQASDRAPLAPEHGRPVSTPPPVVELIAPGGPPASIDTEHGRMLVAAVPGPRRAWLTLGPCMDASAKLESHIAFLLPVVAHFMHSALEIDHAAYELAERYEEINLLYTTSEILGRTVSLEEAAARILEEISDVVGARRAGILVHDRVTDTLQVVTSIGFEPQDVLPISVEDGESISARVFREQRARILEDGDVVSASEAVFRRGTLLSVPILWTHPSPDGSLPLGVVNLSDRRSKEPFSAGDEKLITAIATQIGTAIQNARLVRASLAQQRLRQEMQLAHDLQMKLLPNTTLFAPDVTVAARVIPAESVGGDFYNLFRLSGGRIGVMIGDVSSHGYRAALIMALVMSASTIHAQSHDDPGEMLAALLGSLREELESTEMFVSVFYAVIDPGRGHLRYANAGHPHAFVLGDCAERLAALDPPLGMTTDRPHAAERPWQTGRDLLILFTDGISDARNRLDVRLGERTVLEVAEFHRNLPPDVIAEQIFTALDAHAGDVFRRDDLTLVVAKT
jgi:phosphoserine phosphatase RsbU/P